MNILGWILGMVKKDSIIKLIQSVNITDDVTKAIAKLPISDSDKTILVANVNSIISVILNVIVVKILGTK